MVIPQPASDLPVLGLLSRVQKRAQVVPGRQLCRLFLVDAAGRCDELALSDIATRVIRPGDNLVAAPTAELAARPCRAAFGLAGEEDVARQVAAPAQGGRGSCRRDAARA